MAAEGVFLVVETGLTLLRDHPYDSEAVLQRAIEDYPDVIAGSSTLGEDAQHLVLVAREMPVPTTPASSSLLKLDHLFLDHDAVPVLVEVKRANDTRIRREVVGQMLDYAANAMKYWPVEDIRAKLEATAAADAKKAAADGQTSPADGQTADDLIIQAWPDIQLDDYWPNLQANIGSGRIRLLFVADRLPPSLVRIIEFLNEQMSPAEVLGVEVRQFSDGTHVAYVPNVVGKTTAAVNTKARTGGLPWTEELFLEAAAGRLTEPELLLVGRLLNHVRQHGGQLSFGRGATPGVNGWYRLSDGKDAYIWNLNLNSAEPPTKPYLFFHFPELAKRLPAGVIQEARALLAAIPGLADRFPPLPASDLKKYPKIYLSEIASSKDAVDTIFDVIQQLTSTSPGTHVTSTHN